MNINKIAECACMGCEDFFEPDESHKVCMKFFTPISWQIISMCNHARKNLGMPTNISIFRFEKVLHFTSENQEELENHKKKYKDYDFYANMCRCVDCAFLALKGNILVCGASPREVYVYAVRECSDFLNKNILDSEERG